MWFCVSPKTETEKATCLEEIGMLAQNSIVIIDFIANKFAGIDMTI